jgi:hypothetical protein
MRQFIEPSLMPVSPKAPPIFAQVIRWMLLVWIDAVWWMRISGASANGPGRGSVPNRTVST